MAGLTTTRSASGQLLQSRSECTYPPTWKGRTPCSFPASAQCSSWPCSRRWPPGDRQPPSRTGSSEPGASSPWSARPMMARGANPSARTRRAVPVRGGCSAAGRERSRPGNRRGSHGGGTDFHRLFRHLHRQRGRSRTPAHDRGQHLREPDPARPATADRHHADSHRTGVQQPENPERRDAAHGLAAGRIAMKGARATSIRRATLAVPVTRHSPTHPAPATLPGIARLGARRPRLGGRRDGRVGGTVRLRPVQAAPRPRLHRIG